MKITPRNISGFLAKPPPEIVAVLLYGHDAGLIDERSQRLMQQTVADIDDPFSVNRLTPDAVAADPALLLDSAAVMPIMGGRRLVLIRGGGASLLAACRQAFEYHQSKNLLGHAMVIITANDSINTRSPLVKLFEQSASAAAIGCYPDSDSTLAAMVQESFRHARVSVDRDALDWIVAHLGANRMMSRMECEKLILLAGCGGHLNLSQVQHALSDGTSITTTDIIYAAASGDTAALGQAIDRARAEAIEGERILSNAIGYFSRLLRLTAYINDGMSPNEAIKAHRPPIYFSEQRQIENHLRVWPVLRCHRALDRLAQAERQSRQGIDAFMATNCALLALASMARR